MLHVSQCSNVISDFLIHGWSINNFLSSSEASLHSSVGTVDLLVNSLSQMNEGVVSKETVVLRWWGSSIQKFGFINGVDNVNWPPYRDSKSF